MTSTESINVEMNIGGGSKAAGANHDASILGRIRKYLNPGEHTILENSLAAVVLLLFIIVIALAATRGGAVTVPPDDPTCQLQSCMIRSGYVVSLTNLSAKPCDDFYKYACGGASQVYPLNPYLLERSVLSDVFRKNEDKLEAILLSPVVRNTPDSYERKLKNFFSTCNDDFMIERTRGSDLVSALSPNFYLIDDSTVNNFDLDQMLLTAVRTYGVQAFFHYIVDSNPYDANKYTLEIEYGGTEMQPEMYVFSFFRRQREAYRVFIRSVAQLLVGDAKPGSVQAGHEARIETFVEDVMEIETALANITLRSEPPDSGNPLRPENQVSLSDMNRLYSGISWTSLFIQLFESSVQESTKVVVWEPDYLNQVTSYIRETLRVLYPVDYKRKLSNYLNWQIIRYSTGDLSSSYVHARREFEFNLYSGTNIVESRFDYCFNKAWQFMLKGLNSLFVADHVVDQSKNAVDDIYKVLQTQLISGIDRLDWIDSAAKEKAKRKVRAIIDKIGYSVTEIEDSYLDELYRNFRVDPRDSLVNMSLSWQVYNRRSLGSLLGTQLSKLDWFGATFSTRVSMSSAVELTIPAGILQSPIFTKQLPGYINYATIGHRIATELVKSIDASGQVTDENGNVNPMWSTQTRLNYAEKTKCVNSTYSGLRAGPYVVGNASLYVNVGPIILRNLRQEVAELAALRMAISAYQGTAAAKTDQPLPLTHLDKRQAFFVSWAQSFCYTRNPRFSYTRAQFSRMMPEEIHVNGILSMLPEFGQAFQCPAGSNMVSANGGCDPIFYK